MGERRELTFPSRRPARLVLPSHLCGMTQTLSAGEGHWVLCVHWLNERDLMEDGNSLPSTLYKMTA